MNTAYSATVAGGATLLAPMGSVPHLSALTIGFGGELFAESAADVGAGAVYRLTGGGAVPFATGLGNGYLGGLAFDGSTLYVGDTGDAYSSGPGQVIELDSNGGVLGSVSLAGGGGTGCFDLALSPDGTLIASTGRTITMGGGALGTFSGAYPFPTFLAFQGSGFQPYTGDGMLVVNGVYTDVGQLFAVRPVPEPAAWLFGLALVPLLRRRR
jgi:hypothetical protein